MQELENLLLFLARSLVDDPGRVEVSASETDSRVDLELKVAPEDMGKVIGKKGRIARAIRALVRAAGSRQGVTTLVEIVE